MDVHDVDAEKQRDAVIPPRKSRNYRISRLAAACIIQSLLTTLCLAISSYSLGTVQSVEWKLNRGKDIGIYLEVMGEVRQQMEKLKFRVHWKHKMDLGKGNTTVSFQCSGPYVVHVSACSVYMENQELNGSLILEWPGINQTIIQLRSQDDCDGENSQRDHKMISFTKYDNVSLRFTSENLKLRYLRLGFHYLLGEQCFGHT
ncbi:uncharacterized protein LOC118226233 isoform X2 [Anguilla anguilla]|uniref:uncharacterized protein LOC118226233 isoform X2 n=1 Tax=Anguilla anguilla TaxID=7936 RepID=UPI0015B1C900|nr:uncharacterized protein LOC118226233 isoform X2 [Anguilla anguilla]